MYIYISGPISSDPHGHAEVAMDMADNLVKLGHIPYIPHLSVFWHDYSPKDYEEWMRIDFGWIKKCDVLLRLPGESPGADREMELAESLGIPIITKLEELP